MTASTASTASSQVSQAVPSAPVILTEVDKVKAAFLAEIEKNGLVRTFEWMSGWFDRVAHAQARDEVDSFLGEHAKDPQARGLHLAGLVSQLAGGISNQSTLESANMFRRSRLAALATMMQKNYHGYGSNVEHSEKWDAWNAQTEAKKSTAPAQKASFES